MRCRKKSGFTFIEFLLGSLIFAVIAAALYSTFASGLKVQQRANNEGLLYHQAKLNLDMIARELESAVSIDLSRSYPVFRSFEANSQGFSFLIVDQDQVKRVRYYLQNAQEVSVHKVLLGRRSQKNVAVTNINSDTALSQATLMRSEQPLSDLLGSGAGHGERQEIVLEHIDAATFQVLCAYLTTTQGMTDLEWKQGWDKDYLPAGVRIAMTLLPIGRDKRPVMIVKDIYIPTGFWEEAL